MGAKLEIDTLMKRAKELEAEKADLQNTNVWTEQVQQLHTEGIATLQQQIDMIEKEMESLKQQHQAELTAARKAHLEELEELTRHANTIQTRMEGLKNVQHEFTGQNEMNMKEMHSVFQAMQDLQQQFFAFAAQISMLDKNVSRAVPSPQVARPMEFRTTYAA